MDFYATCALTFPWKKRADFQVWKVANHWNATTKRFMKKLGSLPRDLVLICEPKIKLPNKNGTKFLSLVPTGALNWNPSELFVAREFNTTNCHIVQCQRRESRFWKVFQTVQSSLLKGRWRGSPKPPLAWKLEALFGIPAKTISLGFWGSLILTSIFKDIKSFLWLNRLRLPPKNSTKSSRVTSGFLTYCNPWQLCFFLNLNSSTEKQTPPAMHSVAVA